MNQDENKTREQSFQNRKELNFNAKGDSQHFWGHCVNAIRGVIQNSNWFRCERMRRKSGRERKRSKIHCRCEQRRLKFLLDR